MDTIAKNLMKMKRKTFKDLSLKVRDILFFNADCFEKMMVQGGEESFDYHSFFEFVSSEELLLDMKRYQAIKSRFLAADTAYKEYKRLDDIQKKEKENDFLFSPDQILQQIGFFYDVYLKSRALETYYSLLLKVNEGEKLLKNEERKFQSMARVCSDLEEYLVQNKFRAVEKMFLTYGEGRILFASKKVQSHLQGLLHSTQGY